MAKNKKTTPQGRSRDPEHVLVYSTDAQVSLRCAKCGKANFLCVCATTEVIDYKSIRPVVRIEKKGRGGKVVTLLVRLPTQEAFLKELCAFLKKSFGTGGTFYIEEQEGVVEIQGDRAKGLLELVTAYLQKKAV